MDSAPLPPPAWEGASELRVTVPGDLKLAIVGHWFKLPDSETFPACKGVLSSIREV